MAGLSSADERGLRSDGGMYQATVSQGPEDRARPGGGEGTSIDSGDSRQLIIKKDLVIKKEVKWSVEREGGGDKVKDGDSIVRVEEPNP